MDKSNIHATCVDIGGVGILIMGEPGTGKSSLALSLIDTVGFGIGRYKLQARLVADDQVIVNNIDDNLIASAPKNINGKIEVRGVGIFDIDYLEEIKISIIIKLSNANIERIPDINNPIKETILGVDIPVFFFNSYDSYILSRIRALISKLI